MINIFAIVEINGCILNLAMKNPAVIANTVVKSIHTHNANIALDAGAIPEKSKTCPNTVPVLIPLCMIMVAVTIPIPTIRLQKGLYLSEGSDRQLQVQGTFAVKPAAKC